MEQWAADIAVPGEQLGFGALPKGLNLSHGHFLPEPGFEPQPWVTSGFKSNALSIRPRLPHINFLYFVVSLIICISLLFTDSI